MKTQYSISIIKKSEAKTILDKYHYLSYKSKGFKSGYNYGLFKDKILVGKSKGFKSGYNYGLFKDKILVGVCIYTGFPVPELVNGMFGLERTDQDGFFELSRLCLEPTVQNEEHNLASWFVSRTIRELKKTTNVRSILSYADSDVHLGTIYRACNFVYYGKSDQKSDFWIKQTDGSFIKHSRGKIKGVEGCWIPRSRKYRFAMIFDKTLNMKWKKVK